MSTDNIVELETLAKNGDVGAIYELGKAYYYGTGVDTDYDKARTYFELAASIGSNWANYYLGKIYYNGNGVQTDHNKAREYFEKSANTNNIFSTYYLGKIYYWGDGVEKNYDKAVEYKNIVLSGNIYQNQDTSVEEFYSIDDFEQQTKDYVEELQAKVWDEYQTLYGQN